MSGVQIASLAFITTSTTSDRNLQMMMRFCARSETVKTFSDQSSIVTELYHSLQPERSAVQGSGLELV